VSTVAFTHRYVGDLFDCLAEGTVRTPALVYSANRSTGSICAPPTDRQRVTKGPGSRAAGIAIAVKLIECAQAAGTRSTHPTW
jgi:hypothetical protein